MNASGTALQGKHTVEARELYMAFELGEKNWKLALGDGVRSPSRYTVAAGDTAALLECIARPRRGAGLRRRREGTAVMRRGGAGSGWPAGSADQGLSTSGGVLARLS